MVREPYDGIIGEAPIGAIPLGRVATVRGSLRRHAYTVILEAVMRGKSGAKPAGLSQLNLNAAGIDVGATSHYVAVPADRAEQPVQEFESFTADLYRLADWLAECGVEAVVMESTGVYWIPLFGVLEERGFQVMLVDPRRIKNVPGRKTDVLDCQWLQQLHTYGLLSGAFRPDGEVRRLRSYLRQRVMLVQYASHHIQHMQKALTQMNVKLHHVISDITGKTGLDIIEAIVGGQRDPRQLAQLRDPRIKADEATIAKSLQGHWREEHIFELTQALELYRFYQDKIAECDREIEAQLERFEDLSNGDLPAAKSGRRRSKGNAPRFDVWTHLYRMTGVDLTQIDGVDAYTALKVVSEIGTDMTKWTSAKHFASWLGLSPNNRITGGKVISSKTKPSANRASAALRLAGNALHHSDSALGAFLRRKKAQMGAQGHHCHGPQAGSHHLFHAALRPRVRGRWCGILRTSISAAGVARGKESGGATGLSAGAHARCSGTHNLRTLWRADCRVTTVVSGEQSYARVRAVQRRLTGKFAPGCMLMARRVVRTKTERTLVRIARWVAWSGSRATASLVTPHQRRSRSGDCTLSVAPSGDPPTR